MGRARKPSHLRLVEGTDRGAKGKGRGKRIDREPVPAGHLDPDTPPEDFDEAEKQAWADAIRNAPLGMLRSLDAGILRLWCVAFVLHADARRKLKASSMLTKTTNGNVVQNPYLGVINRQAVLMKALAAELGFSPAARTRIALEEGGDGEDATDRFFKI